MNNLEQVWNQVLSYAQKNEIFTGMSLQALKEAQPIKLEQNVLTIKVENFIHVDVWKNRLKDNFSLITLNLFGEEIIPHAVTAKELEKTPETTPKLERTIEPAQKAVMANINLKDEYTFETFVEGKNNKFAYTAASAVADAPGNIYNPLFIFGGVGLGKTHLMHAIGHYALKQKPDMHIKYVTAENFMNDFVQSIQKKGMEEFREEYRTLDLLLIDDIQFLNKETQTQQEFFHTFEALHNEGKQIVLTSDRLPKDLDKIEDRLVTRFDWGLSVDIQPAEYETRLAILKNKAEVMRPGENGIPEDVLEIIAVQFTENIRELEGALMRVIAYHSMMGIDIKLDTAIESLKILKSGNVVKKEATIAIIQDIVANHYGITVKDLKSKRRIKAISGPRQIAMYLSRELTNESLPAIGADFGGKDHTTVMYAHRQTTKRLKDDYHLQNDIKEIKEKLK